MILCCFFEGDKAIQSLQNQRNNPKQQLKIIKSILCGMFGVKEIPKE
jgi:hypothetical protein